MVCKVFTPLTAMFTTMIAEIIFILSEYIYINKNLKIKPQFFSKKNLIYFSLSILFVPISLIVKYINFGFYLNIFIIIVLCVTLYGGTLLLIKDENVLLIKNKIFNIFRRK